MQITMIQRSTQTGATLATALIFLVVISLLSVTSIRSGTMGVRMSQNEEARFAAIQAAQALTEAIVASPASTPVIGGAGFSICTVGEPGCNLLYDRCTRGLRGRPSGRGKLEQPRRALDAARKTASPRARVEHRQILCGFISGYRDVRSHRRTTWTCAARGGTTRLGPEALRQIAPDHGAEQGSFYETRKSAALHRWTRIVGADGPDPRR